MLTVSSLRVSLLVLQHRTGVARPPPLGATKGVLGLCPPRLPPLLFVWFLWAKYSGSSTVPGGVVDKGQRKKHLDPRIRLERRGEGERGDAVLHP